MDICGVSRVWGISNRVFEYGRTIWLDNQIYEVAPFSVDSRHHRIRNSNHQRIREMQISEKIGRLLKIWMLEPL
jgi:ribonuclease PH